MFDSRLRISAVFLVVALVGCHSAPLVDTRTLDSAGMSYDSVKTRPLAERCLIGFSSTSGPPMLPVLYNNNYQIVQTRDNVMILVEMVHDARIIRINGTHAPANATPRAVNWHRRWFCCGGRTCRGSCCSAADFHAMP